MDRHNSTRTADFSPATLWTAIATLAGGFRRALRGDRHIRVTEALSLHLQHDVGYLDRDPRLDADYSHRRATRDALAVELLRLP